jgi:hypothetical protein
VAEDRDRWWAVVTTVMNFRVSVAELLVAFQEGLCSMALVG